MKGSKGQTRREFLKSAGLGATVMLSQKSLSFNKSEEKTAYHRKNVANRMGKQPNVLIIYTDQQNPWTIGAYGGKLVETPNIDRIAQEGSIFNNFFTNTAVCTPSRGSFLTGRYHHSHGAWVNGRPINQNELTFAKILKKHGYDTGYAGKWHLDGYDQRPGWVHPERSMGFTNCHFMFNDYHGKKMENGRQNSITRTPYDATYKPVVFPLDILGDEKTYTTDFLTDKAIEFIEKPRQGMPFCYMLSIPDPHHPFSVRSPYDSMFKPEDMPIPSTFSQEILPRWAKTVQANNVYALSNPDREKALRKIMAAYCGMVKLIDDCLGRILKTLEQLRILDETIVVFTTDHGDYMGEHGLPEKNQSYEPVYHIPMLIRWPEEIAKETIINNIVTNVDFQQTLLGLVGSEPSGREQGRDASPLLRGEMIEWVDQAFIYQHGYQRAGIITPEYQLVYVESYYSYEDKGVVKCNLSGPENDAILFDRKNDPEQVRNLIHDPEYKDIINQLTKRIVEHNIAVDSPTVDWLKTISMTK